LLIFLSVDSSEKIWVEFHDGPQQYSELDGLARTKIYILDHTERLYLDNPAFAAAVADSALSVDAHDAG
jgi:hypothetical protein